MLVGLGRRWIQEKEQVTKELDRNDTGHSKSQVPLGHPNGGMLTVIQYESVEAGDKFKQKTNFSETLAYR